MRDARYSWRVSARVPLLLLALASCSQADLTTCTGPTLVLPILTVTNASSGAPICDATVTVTTGPTLAGDDAAPSPDVLAVSPLPDGGPGACSYGGAALGEGGTYVLRVTAPGFGTATLADVVVQSKACGQAGVLQPAQRVSVALPPS
jgi:hypothetical protein